MITTLGVSRRFARAVLVASALLVALAPARAVASTTVVAHVPVGLNPAAIAVDPVSHRVWAADYFGDSVHLIDGVSDSVVATVPMPTTGAAGAVPIAVVADPLTGVAWVANWQSHWVSRVDGATGQVLGSTRVSGTGSGNPRALALDPTSSPPKLYVADYHTNTVSVLDASTGALLRDISVGASPRALGLFVGGGIRRLYVADRYGATVDIIDGASDSVIATAPVGEAPKAIAVDPNTGNAWVTSTASDTVSVIAPSGAVVAHLPMGDNPVGVAVDAVGRRVLVANYLSSSVTVIDADTRTTIATVTTGPSPYAIGFDQSQRVAYVTCYGSSNGGTTGLVTVIDSSLTSTHVEVGDHPYGVAVDEGATPHKAYVTEWASNAVSVLDPDAPVSSPVRVDITPMPGDATISSAPVLTGTATSLRAPRASAVVAVFWRLEGERKWRRATITEGQGSPSVRWEVRTPDLAMGAHSIEVAAMDQALALACSSDQGASGVSAALGASQTYPFTVFRHVEETDTRLYWEGGWTKYVNPSRSGGSMAYTTSVLAGADVAFEGSDVRVVSSRGPDYGIAGVSIDGSPLQRIDLYATRYSHQQAVFRASGLAPGPHTLRISCTGDRNAASTGVKVGVDAFEVAGDLQPALSAVVRAEETDPRLVWEGVWTAYSNANRSGGSMRYTSSPGSALDVAFSGIEVRLVGSRGPDYGIASVAVDGGPPEVVDMYAPAYSHRQVLFRRAGLAPGAHTLRFTYEGARNPASAGVKVGVDAVDVLGVIEQALMPAAAEIRNVAVNKKALQIYTVTLAVPAVPTLDVSATGGTSVEYALYASAAPAPDLSLSGATVALSSARLPLMSAASPSHTAYYQACALVRRADGTVARRLLSGVFGPAPSPQYQMTVPIPVWP